jgi:uncharacterized Fe-S cluster protein YjdI
MSDIIKKYTKEGLTIVWKPEMCIHSTVCWKAATGLPSVFNPFEKPWIKLEGASIEELVGQIRKCPSGALSFYMEKEGADYLEKGSGD